MTKSRNSEAISKSSEEPTITEHMDKLSTEDLMAMRRGLILNSALLALAAIGFEVSSILALPYANEGVMFALMAVVFLATLWRLFRNGHRISLANDRIDPAEAQKNFD